MVHLWKLYFEWLWMHMKGKPGYPIQGALYTSYLGWHVVKTNNFKHFKSFWHGNKASDTKIGDFLKWQKYAQTVKLIEIESK